MLEILLEGMSLMGYDALNLGGNDLQYGKEFLDEQQHEAAFPFLSANLLDSASYAPMYSPYAVKEVGDLRVGIIGLASPTEGTGSLGKAMQVSDPANVLARLLPRVRKEAQIIVVLAHMPYAEAMPLLSRAEGVNVLIVADEGELAMTPQESSGVLVIGAGKQGKYVGYLQIVANFAGQIVEYRGEVVELDEHVGEDSVQLELLARHGIR